ncbi:hypothetical protein ACA910_012920 [Epithemia clementina (nom. ined.)]
MPAMARSNSRKQVTTSSSGIPSGPRRSQGGVPIVEEWRSPPPPRCEQTMGTFRDYLSDITGEEEAVTGGAATTTTMASSTPMVAIHQSNNNNENGGDHDDDDEIDDNDSPLMMIDTSQEDDEEENNQDSYPHNHHHIHHHKTTTTTSAQVSTSSSRGPQIRSPPRTNLQPKPHQPMINTTTTTTASTAVRTVSPFSPDPGYPSSNPRSRRNGGNHPITEDHQSNTAGGRPSTASSNVTWDGATTPHQFLSCAQNQDGSYGYSLNDERVVSVLVHVRDPPPKASSPRVVQEGRLPCVVPLAAFLNNNNNNNNNEENNNVNRTRSKNETPSSPASIVKAAVDDSRKLVVINPRAFGDNVPNQVSMEVLRKIVGRDLSSEDWAREFRFSKVLWPSGALLGLHRLAMAISNDLTAPASIAHRIVFAYGKEEKKFTMFGTSITNSVAQSFAQPSTTTEDDQQVAFIAQQYGVVGLTLQGLLKFKSKAEENATPTTPALYLIGLSMMEITGDIFHDLTEKWSGRGPSSSGNNDAPRLKLVYDGESPGGIIAGLRIHEVDSLKALGHHFRRAFTIADFKDRETKRGHIIATLYFYRNPDEFGRTHKLPVAHFVDLATPTVPSSPNSKTRQVVDLSTAETLRNAFVRKSVTALGATLRACLLREAGNHATLSFRESMLTQFLQKSIDHQDGKSVLLTSISPMIDEYDKTMEFLRFSHRLLERPGDPPKSPFDSLTKTVTSTTKTNTDATGPSSTTVEHHQHQQQQHHISLSEFDEKYHPSLLKTLTSDARQRLSKAGFQPNPPPRNYVYLSSHMTEASEATAPTTTTGEQPQYEEIDPATFYEYRAKQESKQNPSFHSPPPSVVPSPRTNLPMSLLPTPQARNLSYPSRRKIGSQSQTSPAEVDTTFALSSVEQGSFLSTESLPDQYPSPITTDTGDNGAPDMVMEAQNILASNSRQQTKDDEYLMHHSRHHEEGEYLVDVNIEDNGIRVDGKVASIRNDQDGRLQDESLLEHRTIHSNRAPDNDHAMDDSSLDLRDKVSQDQAQHTRNQQQQHQQQQHAKAQSPFMSTSPQRVQRPPRPSARDGMTDRHDPQTTVHVNRLHSGKTHDLGGPPAVVDDNSDTDTVSQMGEIDATYVRLNQSQRANAESVSSHLLALRETEQSIIKRISAERDSLKRHLERLMREHERELTIRDRQHDELRQQLAKVSAERQEFHQIAEEAVAGKEELVHSLKEKEAQLRTMESETVKKESFEQLKQANHKLSVALEVANDDLEGHKEEITKQEYLITELQTSLSNYESESKQQAQTHRKDAEKIEELNEQLLQARSEVSSLRAEMAHSRKDLTQAERLFGQKEKELRRALEETERNLDVARAEASDSASKLEMMQKHLDQLHDENNRVQKDAAEEQDFLRREIDGKNDEIHSLKESLSAFREELDRRAADVTELQVANDKHEAAKEVLERELHEERAGRKKSEMTREGLQHVLERLKDEAMKSMDPIAHNFLHERAITRSLAAENDELRLRNEKLLERIQRQMEEIAEAKRYFEETEGLIYRGPPIEPFCQLCRGNGFPVVDSGNSLSMEKLENLALDLSLIIRGMPLKRERIDELGLAGLEEHTKATEKIVNVLLNVLRKRTTELRERQMLAG